MTSEYNRSRFYRQPDAWRLARGSITFDGTAGKGAQGTVTLFDVTGDVEVRSPVGLKCATDLTGALATIEVGISSDTDYYAEPATATDWDAGEWWDSINAEIGALGQNLLVAQFATDIIATIATADITGGSLQCYVWWRPLSADGNVALGANMEAI
jgi:hypothetical protein